jgi:hypothetical protein
MLCLCFSIVCRDVRVFWLLWQVDVAQWWAWSVGRDLGARPLSSSRGLRILGPMRPLYRRVLVFWFRFHYVFKNSKTSLSMYLFCNSRIHVITLYSGHVYVYYTSKLWCWHLIWILVRTDHPLLGVGCHTKFQGKTILRDIYPLDDTTLDPRCYRQIKRLPCHSMCLSPICKKETPRRKQEWQA